MRGIFLTFVPMLAAAALVVWGGERLARRTSETRIPADRERLHDFSAALRGELDRLDHLYQAHLSRISSLPVTPDERALQTACENLVGIRECHVFRRSAKVSRITVARPPTHAGRVPEIEIKGRKSPLDPKNAVVFPGEIADTGKPGDRGWLNAPGSAYRVHWQIPEADCLVAFIVDSAALNDRIHLHLGEWLQAPFAPLVESGELVSIATPDGRDLAPHRSSGDQGPAALVMPHRTNLGEWQVEAWDCLSIQQTRDPGTLALAGSIACCLVLLGIMLFVQQRRAARLAEERVSFVNRVSHELGAPLTNILLNLDLATESLASRPAESGRRLSLVGEEVHRLARLVANVLTFSQGERKTLELRSSPCVADDLIASVLDHFQPSLERRKVRVEWQRGAPDGIRIDPDAFTQIVGNLVSNVEKYAGGGGWIGLDSRLENDRLLLRISDRGPGIFARHREKIFEAFERVHRGVNEGSSGTGLGLSIARDLARRMEGDLMLVSSAAGSVFELDIPAPPVFEIVKSDESAA